MGRLSHVTWPSYIVVLSLATLALLLVWFARGMVRYMDTERPPEEEIWSADAYDVTAGLALFVIVAFIGIVVACSSSPQNIVLISDSIDLLSSDLPAHITRVQQWTGKDPPIKRETAVPLHSPGYSQPGLDSTSHQLTPGAFDVEGVTMSTSYMKDPFRTLT